MEPGTSWRLCKRCVLPHSPPDITLDEQGVCSVCRLDEQVQAATPRDEFLETDFVRLLKKHQGKGRYDCMVMCSGGKDSTAALYYMKKRYHMNPLAFTFDHGFETPEAMKNVHNAVEALGVDFLFFRTEIMKDVFRKMVETRSKAVICHPCSIWYMQLTFDLAARFKIPLIIAGWTKGQSARPGVMTKCACNIDAPEYGSMAGATRQFLATLKDDPRFKDFPATMEEVVARARKKHKSIVLSPHWFLEGHPDNYVAVIEKELGWKYPTVSYPGKSTNCLLNFLSVHESMRNYGYTHYHVEMSKLIRQGLMTRDEALELLRLDFGAEVLDQVASKLDVRLGDY
jgi:Queuosine biosynthesis protein QueC